MYYILIKNKNKNSVGSDFLLYGKEWMKELL